MVGDQIVAFKRLELVKYQHDVKRRNDPMLDNSGKDSIRYSHVRHNNGPTAENVDYRVVHFFSRNLQ